MKRLGLFFLFIFFILSSGFPQEQDKINKQKISDPYVWDFGKVKLGEVLQHNFTFKNETKSVLTIKALNSSCGCAVPQVKDKVLKSGQSTLIEVKFNTKGYAGPVQQYVYVNTDDLNNPIFRLIIKAEVVK